MITDLSARNLLFGMKSRRVSPLRTLMTSAAAAAVLGFSTTAQAAVPITGTQLQSNVGTTVDPDFEGGTLRDDVNAATDNHAYNVGNVPTNTLDEFGNSVTFTGTFSGTGPLTLTDSVGGGNAIFTGTSVLGGAVTVDTGATLTWGNGGGGAFLIGPDLGVVDNGSLVMDFGGASGVVGDIPISGTGSVTVHTGTFEELGPSTYTGGTTIDAAGTLTLGSSGGGDNGTLVGNIVDNGLLRFDYAGVPVTADNAISGIGAVEFQAGTTVIIGGSAVGGTVTIDSGATAQWGDGIVGGSFLVGGGNAVVDNGALVMDFGTGVVGPLPISGTGTVEIQSGLLSTSGVSTYSGATTIDAAGTLALTGAGSISNSGVVIDDGVFDISGTAAGTSITTLEGAGGVSLGAQTLTLTNASGIFSGVLADGGSGGGVGGGLTIQLGTETLSGTNTYTGDTTVDLGSTLVLGDGGTTGTVAGNVVDNGLVQFNYGGSVVNPNAFSGGGSAEMVAGTAVFTDISFLGGAVTIDPGATMQWGNGGLGLLAGAGGTVVDNGALVLDFGGAGLGASISISGTGSFELKSGSFNNNAVSTYTGTTTVDAGAIMLLTSPGSISNSSDVIDNGVFDIGSTAGTPITTLEGSGGVSLGAQTLTLTNASGIFSGVLADGSIFFPSATGGALTIGAGTETLSGTNTYTGPTTINPGATLALGNGGTTGTVAGNIVDNGLVQFNYGGPVITPNTLSGGGAAEMVAGTTVFTGFSILGGTVTIDPGATMQWGNGSVGLLVGAGSGVVDNGALVVDIGGGGIGGIIPISGSGALEVKSGALNDSAVSTFTGPTTIDAAGLLALSGTGSISNSSDIIDNGVFDISNTAAGTSITTLDGAGGVSLGGQTLTLTNASGIFGGVLADGGVFGGTGGALTVAGGTETLTGTNTYTGPTTINPGATLSLGNGGTTGSVASNIVDNGALNVNHSNTLVFLQSISGSGALNQIGTGTTVLDAVNPFSGLTTVSAGTLQLGDSTHPGATLGGNVVVAPHGTLKGIGTVAGTVTNGGTFAPGNSIGIFNVVNGPFTQTAAGTLQIELNPAAAPVAGINNDQVRITGVPGTAVLAGTLQLQPAAGFYIGGANYDVIDATGGISGGMALTGAPDTTFINFSTSAANGGGIVTIAGTHQVYRVAVVRLLYNSVATNPNQVAVADGLQNLVAGATGDALTVVHAIDVMTPAQAQTLFDQASPEPYGAYANALLNQGELFTRQVALQMHSTPNNGNGASVWGRGYGQWGNGKDRSFRFGSDQDIYGGALGVDYTNNGFVIGGAVGWSHDKVKYDPGTSDGRDNSWQAGLYGSYTAGAIDFDLQAAYLHGSFRATRTINVATLNRVAEGDGSGNEWKIIGTVGYNADLSGIVLRPFIGFDFSDAKLHGFTETGADALNLTVSSIHAKRDDVLVGVDVGGKKGMGLQPYGRLVYRYDLSSHNRPVTAFLNGDPASEFTVSAEPTGRSEFDADAGVSYQFNPAVMAFAGFEGTFRNDHDGYGVSAGLRINFGGHAAPPPPPPPPPPPATQTCPDGAVILATAICPAPPPPPPPPVTRGERG